MFGHFFRDRIAFLEFPAPENDERKKLKGILAGLGEDGVEKCSVGCVVLVLRVGRIID